MIVCHHVFWLMSFQVAMSIVYAPPPATFFTVPVVNTSTPVPINAVARPTAASTKLPLITTESKIPIVTETLGHYTDTI